MQVMVRLSVFAEAVRDRRENFIEESRTLATLRDDLLPRLIGGKLRVDVDEETG